MKRKLTNSKAIFRLSGMIMFLAFGLVFSNIVVCASAEPGLIGEWNLTSAKDGIVKDSASGLYNGRMMGWEDKSISGNKNGLTFDGKKTYIEVPYDAALTPINSVTFEVWLAPKISGFLQYVVCNGGSSVRLVDKRVTLIVYNGKSWYDLRGTKKLEDDQWYHIVCTYDSSSMKVYVDGELDVSQAAVGPVVKHTNWPFAIGANPYMLSTCLFKGQIGYVRIYDRALSLSEIRAHEKTPEFIKALTSKTLLLQKRNLTINIDSMFGEILLDSYCKPTLSMDKKTSKLLASLDNLKSLAENSSNLNSLQTVAKRFALVKKNNFQIKTFAKIGTLFVYQTPPAKYQPILPDTNMSKLKLLNADSIKMVVCPGQYETASLVLNSPKDVKSLQLKASSFRSAEGNIITSDAVDMKVVKCWYQDGSAGWEIWRYGDKVMVPELLLHDDLLVKADTQNKQNYVKVKDASGNYSYICVSDAGYGNSNKDYDNASFDVRDAKSLVPFELTANSNKQIFVTVKMPDKIKPGLYSGKINFISSGNQIGTMPFKLRVLPFSLPEPKTFHNAKKGFTFSVYYWGELTSDGKTVVGGIAKNSESLVAEFKNMKQHGITSPMMIFRRDMLLNKPEILEEYLNLYTKAGLGGPVYLAAGDVWEIAKTEEDIKTIKSRVQNILSVFRKHGIDDVYFYGIDEAEGETLIAEKKAFDAVHEAGGKNVVSGSQGHFAMIGKELDLLNWCGIPSKSDAAEWHSIGHSIWAYSNPQAGYEDPEIYRRNFGMNLWKADFDGTSTYCYVNCPSGNNCWNDFFEGYRQMSMVYPSADGVIDTIQWEGYRYAVNDVKYASYLKSLAENNGKKAGKAMQFLNKLIPENSDPDAVRLKTIGYILELR